MLEALSRAHAEQRSGAQRVRRRGATQRLVFTWVFEGSTDLPPGSSTVDITLHADGDGTIVQLRHESLPMDVSREQHAMGWRHYVERLPVVAAGSDPGPDWN